MRRCLAIIAILLLAGCHRPADIDKLLPPPKAYIHFNDRVAAQMFHWGIPWASPCYKTEKRAGFPIQGQVPMDQCVRFDPPRRFHGLWRDNFEGAIFCPSPASRCEESGKNDIWFEWRFSLPEKYEAPGGLYEVEFVGRASSYRGGYGHMGMFPREVIADRLISMTVIEPPPPPLTKAEIVKYWKACEAAGNCVPNWQEINAMEQ